MILGERPMNENQKFASSEEIRSGMGHKPFHHALMQHLDARLVEFNGVGHAPFLSRPFEFNAVLRSFIREKVNGRN